MTSRYRLERGTAGWDNAAVDKLTSPRPGFLSDIVAPGTTNSAALWVSSSRINGSD